MLACVLAAFAAFAEVQLPQPADEYINDFAGVLTATDKSSISAMLRQIHQKSGAFVAVVTANSVEEYAPGYDPEAFALSVFNGWKLGEKAGRSMLIFVSIKDRTVSIELGADKPGIYDNLMQKVVKARMLPNFKEGDYGRGISDGVRTLSKILTNQTDLTDYFSRYMVFIIAGAVLLALIILLLMMPKKSKARVNDAPGQEASPAKEKKQKEKKPDRQKKDGQDNFGGGSAGSW